MKKLLLLAFVFTLSNNVLAKSPTAPTTHAAAIDAKAKKIAANAPGLKPSIVKLGLQALHNSQKHGVHTTKPIITLIDYSLASTEKRLWVLDLNKDQVIHTSMVAHGKHSGENHTTNFSNRIGSLQTSLGVFITQNTYFGHDGLSLKIQGLEKGYNDNAKVRTIVVHGAPYVSKQFVATMGRAGRSWGCPAVEKPLAKPIIDTIKDGTLILAFYPDQDWLTKSKFINQQQA